MPFAALPSSPGFQQPPVPEWGRFAELAIQGIQHGGDIRAQAGKDFAEQVQRSFDQVSKIMEYNSPEAKAKRKLEAIKTHYLTELYEDASANPDKYQWTAHGPVIKDVFTQASKASSLRRSWQQEEINKRNLGVKQGEDALSKSLDSLVDTSAKIKASGKAPVNPPSGEKVVTPDTQVPGSSGVANDPGSNGSINAPGEGSGEGSSSGGSSDENQPPPGGGGAYYGNIEDYWT